VERVQTTSVIAQYEHPNRAMAIEQAAMIDPIIGHLGRAADTAGVSRSNAKNHGPTDSGWQRLRLDRGPRSAIIPRIATRLDRFRC